MRLVAALLTLSLAACSDASAPATADWTTGKWRKACRYDTAALPELSGLAPSIRHPGVLWAINDSGQASTVYALDAQTCRIVGQALLDITQVDFEALASGRDRRGRPVLLIGDIGDNSRRRDSVAIVALAEPDLGTTTNSATVHRFRYPDGPVDAEALMADPSGKHAWVISKSFGARIYRVRLARRTVTAKDAGSAPSFVTDAALDPRVGYAVRDYSGITRFTTPVPGSRLGRSNPPQQPQAEAVAFSADGTWLYTASESDARLLRAPVER